MLRRPTDAHAQAGEIVASQEIQDIAHAIVRSRAALGADAHPAKGQIHVVIHHQQFFRRDLIPVHQLRHGLAAEVHIRLRLGKRHAHIANAAFPHFRLATRAVQFDLVARRQNLHHVEPHIVPGARILCAGVAQAHNQNHSFPPNGPKSARRQASSPEGENRRGGRALFFAPNQPNLSLMGNCS